MISLKQYRDSVSGCWMGKSVGGTLGAPFEWRREAHDIEFYAQPLHGVSAPNDDLDIQLLWLVALEEKGVAIDAHTLAEYWLLYVTPHWAEYGNAKINLRMGLLPPWSGIYENPYKHSCGAFIRSEIWACIAPGCPALAAGYACQDAILDHGDGEGTYAEVFCAALESAAFVVKDIHQLIPIGLSYIPEACGVAGAVRNAMASYAANRSLREARDSLLKDFRGSTAMGQLWCTCEEDQKKGFHEGVLGWDAPSNIGIVVLALLYGEGDFGKTVCSAVNCGEDTDCTAATVGSIMGILHGASAIPARWTDPIGRKVVTACLNLGELGYFGNQIPQTVDELSERTERIARQTLARAGMAVLDDPEGGASSSAPSMACTAQERDALYANLTANVFRFDFFTVAVDYGDDPTVSDGVPKCLHVTITNTYKIAASLNVRWLAPEDWEINPGREGVVVVKPLPWENVRRISFTLRVKRFTEMTARLAVEITLPGRSAVMLVPIVLLNGNIARGQ
ncbi:MAG TPA: ADP-ribosylglycohydrolase family protein [Candidatus Hydrogenedentes bacterium]|nr:ADP-ribosylglycohydrolase family protein [Candidatus Hydrogenedentota bacterium]HOS02270.1 ADP-ribosylglycohydrolase family protein [Candidatus Hydrogenedentota bacterium]